MKRPAELLLKDKLVLPAYEQMVKASHAFNLLDARHAVSVTERQRFILRVRTLARGVAEGYRDSREALGISAAQEHCRGAGGLMSAQDLLFELCTEELPPRTLPALSLALTAGVTKGIDTAAIPHGQVHGFATPRRLAVRIEETGRAPAGPASGTARTAARQRLRRAGRSDPGGDGFRQELRRAVAELTKLNDGQGRVAAISRHRARRGDHRPARRHSSAGHRGAADRQAHALGRAQRRVRQAGAFAWCCSMAMRSCRLKCWASRPDE